MAVYAHRRQILLFVAAILLPCAVLIALGLRMLAQESELPRMGQQLDHAVADQCRGGFVARDQDQYQHLQHLVVVEA